MTRVLLSALVLFLQLGCSALAPGMLESHRAGLREKAGLVEKRVRAGVHDVAYLEGGRGRHVLLLHGATGQKEDWLDVAIGLTPTHHVVAMDYAPFGATAPAPGVTYDLARYATSIVELLDALALHDVHIIGSSMGGHVAAEVARLHPTRVRSVTLVGSPGVRAPKRSPMFIAIEDRGEMPFRAATRADVARFASQYLWVKAPAVPGFLMDHVFDVRVARNAIDMIGVEGDLPSRYDLEPHLGELTMPVFALWGDADPQIDASAIDVVRAGAPGFKDAVVLPACGHLPHVEYPAETTAALLRFLGAAK